MTYKLTWINRATGWKIEEEYNLKRMAEKRAEVINLLGHEVREIEEVQE